MPLRPALPMLALVTGGILAGRFLEGTITALIGAALALLFCLLFHPLRRGAAVLLVLVLAWLNYAVRFQVLTPSDLRVSFGEDAAIVNLRGILLQTPELRVHKEGQTNQTTLARLQATHFRTAGEWQEATGKIAVHTRGTLLEPFYKGDEVILKGVLRPPHEAVADGLFDYRAYLYEQRIFYQLVVEASSDWKLLSPTQNRVPYSDVFLDWAKAQLARGVPSGETLDLIWSMVLGWKTGLTQELATPFMRTGTMHIFAISGLHITFIAGMLVLGLRLMGVPRRISIWSVIPLLWFYTMATGWQSSAVRASIMSSVLFLGMALQRPTHIINSLAVAALLIFIWEPQQLFQASFQLSFLVVASIALALPYLHNLNKRILFHDPLLPPELRPAWQRHLEGPLKFIITSFIISLASWLGALPLTAFYFNLITPVSLLANLILVPISSISLGTSVVSLFLPFLWPLLNPVAWMSMDLTIFINHFFSRFGYYYVPKPPFSFFVFYYSVLVAAVGGTLLRRHYRVALLILSGISGCLFAVQTLQKGQFQELVVLPVGGTPIFYDGGLRTEKLLLDCSNQYEAERVLVPYLRGRGLNQLDLLILSHGDINHVGGFAEIRKEFSPNVVLTSAAQFRSRAYKEALSTLEQSDVSWIQLEPGDCYKSWQILHPSRVERFPKADDKCLVIRKEFAGFSILFLGDLSAVGRNHLLNHYPDLKADILICGVPDREEPCEIEFMQRISPLLVVIGTTREFRHLADRTWRDQTRNSSFPIWLTSEAGTVNLTFQRDRAIARNKAGFVLEIKKAALLRAADD